MRFCCFLRGPVLRAGLLALSLVALLPATTLTFDLNTLFSGDPPAGAGPWARLTFTNDGLPADTVDLLIQNLVSGSEFIGSVYINLDPALNPLALNFAFMGGQIPESWTQGVNCCKADGDGKYDIRFNYETANNPNRFTPGEATRFRITGIAGLDPFDFDYLSFPDGGHGPFKAAAHVQGITGGLSGWIRPLDRPDDPPIPEPGTAVLVACGVAALAFARRRRR